MEPLGAEDPRTIGGYRLLRRIGAGGMGRVYLGRSRGGRTVAVKVVHAHFAADEQFRARFRREVEAARRVGGDWTAPVLDADPDAATPWVATGYVAGPDLHDAVARHGALPGDAARALGAGLAEALATVHARGLVHRDVKPSNVLLTLDGPRLIDFGIARATDATASLTATGVSVGSPGYMAPEQVLGREVHAAADVFSLGAVLAFAATGRPPFPGDSPAALLYKVAHEEPGLSGLDGDLREVAAACLAKEPAARPAVTEVAARLAGAGGAAALMVGGWLPGPVVEGVSRRAVALLELETEDTPADPPTGPGRAAPAPSPAPSTPPPGGGAGVSSHIPAGAYAQRPYEASGSHGPYGPYGTPAPYGGPVTAGPQGARVRTGPSGHAPVWSRTGPLLAGGGVLAAALVGLGLWLLPQGGTPRPTPSDTGVETVDLGDPDTVPEGFLGTWRGDVRSDTGQHGGVLTVVIEEGGPGSDAVRMTTRQAGVDCEAVAKVDSITPEVLTVTDRLVGETPELLGVPLCSERSAPITFTLKPDGSLFGSSEDALAGNPTADLVRVEE
ncbi:serine/threonine-protein kinase [Streptomyces sp. TRM 70351]|uniref:serine/threonine-protein kinase n=1 Tax=Streptomyces sp. TRM 70351 TaxID=3116552 RepID=UPI002E7C2BB1|nr:serine/threonine-protein kinase [Streptomyces sp. TRM 70351]MEE1931011.1 serine/threonine-protein kinase [Streptomyces sp. TRM 70351]